MRLNRLAVLLLSAAAVLPASAAPLRPDQAAFRDIYKEAIETDTSPATGSCTVLAAKMGARLKAAGFSDSELNYFSDPRFPKDGGLIATLPGSDKSSKGITLMAHLDVVNVNRNEWKTDPFTLVEDDKFFHGRGTIDDKAMAAVFVDSLIRYRKEGFHPRRTLRAVLTCGEETGGRFKSAQWLARDHKDWIDADFALNEGGGGELDEQGNRVSLAVQAGERTYQDITLTATDAGGHSARPHKGNPIYAMSAALDKIGAYEFPVQFNDTTRSFFARTAELRGGETGAAMKALLANPKDAAADAIVSQNPEWHASLRTTCTATMIKGGEERSALPEHIEANVNCRIFPGESPDAVLKTLQTVVGNPKVTLALRPVTSTGEIIHVTAPPPPMTPEILGPVQRVASKMWPGVPVIPTMSPATTDGRFLIAAGIPTYGISGMFRDADGDGVHGVDERMPVRSLYEGRDFLYALVKLYANQK